MTTASSGGILGALTMKMPNYICIRDPLRPSVDGKWFDLDIIEQGAIAKTLTDIGSVVSYVPIEEFEEREDGAIAQVYVEQN